MMKSCLNCRLHEVCKFYHGEMSRRYGKTRNYNIILELVKLERLLAKDCSHYLKWEKKDD